jgi:ubiquinol-cytochrome c reductase cytochrome b subunit
MAGSLIVLILLPFIHNPKVKGAVFSPTYKILFWIFASNVVFLTWLGQKAMEAPYQTLGAISTVIYFLYFILLAML